VLAGTCEDDAAAAAADDEEPAEAVDEEEDVEEVEAETAALKFGSVVPVGSVACLVDPGLTPRR